MSRGPGPGPHSSNLNECFKRNANFQVSGIILGHGVWKFQKPSAGNCLPGQKGRDHTGKYNSCMQFNFLTVPRHYALYFFVDEATGPGKQHLGRGVLKKNSFRICDELFENLPRHEKNLPRACPILICPTNSPPIGILPRAFRVPILADRF